MSEPPVSTQAIHTSSGSNFPITRVVIHATESPQGPGACHGVAAYFTDPNSGGSAHYVIDSTDEEHCVAEDTIAWHAPPNQGSIGLEMCCYEETIDWSSDDSQALLRRTASRCADLCARYNVPTIWLSPNDLLNGATGITSHNNVSQAWHQSDHSDPGSRFPVDQFISLVNGGAAVPQGGVSDVPAPTDVTRRITCPNPDGKSTGELVLHADGSVNFNGLTPGYFPNYIVLANTGERYGFGPSRNSGVLAYPGLPPQWRQGNRYFVDLWLG